MEFQDYYKILGVPRTATPAEIKKAYRKLARESHPDQHAGDKAAERRFKEVNEAHAVLSDPAKRAKYDQFGKDWEAYSRAGATAGRGGAGDPFGPGSPFAGWSTFRTGGGSGAGTGPGGVRYEFRTTGDPGAFSDFFRMMFGDESEAAGEPTRFGGGGESIDELLARMGVTGPGGTGGRRATSGDRSRRPAGQARLAPIDVTAEMSLEEAYHGTSRIVELDGRRLEVTVPRGVDTGSRIRLSGKGPDGRDLVVVTKVRPHPVFSRRGADLERDIPITLREALLGGEISIATLKGRVLLTLPAGTQNGRVFRLRGQGMPRFKGDGTGDLYVRVRVVLPTDLSDEAKRAGTRFLDLLDQPDPRT